MKKINIILFLLLFFTSCSETTFLINSAKRIGNISEKPNYKIGNPYKINGQWFYPAVNYQYDEIGIASWYGPNFHGKKTANGEIFDQNIISAAHKTLPLPSIVKVINLENKKELIIRLNDRGPFVRGRIIDLSKKAAEELGVLRNGTAKVRVLILENESRKIALDYERIETFVTNKGVTESVKKENIKNNINHTKISSEPISNNVVISDNSDENVTVNINDFKENGIEVSKKSISIQVAAFNDIRNANLLVKKLLEFKAYIKREFIDNRYFYRVRIGPFTNKSFADKIKKDLYGKGYKSSQIIIESLK